VVVLTAILEIDFEAFKEYVDCVRTIYYRILEDEIRIYAGRVSTRIPYKNEKEKQEILEWLRKLKQTKKVANVRDVTTIEAFFT